MKEVDSVSEHACFVILLNAEPLPRVKPAKPTRQGAANSLVVRFVKLGVQRDTPVRKEFAIFKHARGWSKHLSLRAV